MRIRPVNVEDRAEWIRMRQRLWPNSDSSEVAEWFDSAERSADAAVLVADPGTGSLAGFVEVGLRDYADGCLHSPVAYVEGWYTDPEFRRGGVGRLLISAAEDWARSRGLEEIASDTEIDNFSSAAAHRALGYGEVVRLIVFRKSLVPSNGHKQ